MINIKRGYTKKRVIGGAGLFDTIANLFKRVAGSTAAKAIASRIASATHTEVGRKAIEAGRTVAKEIGLKAIDVGKHVAIAKANALIHRAAAAKHQETIKQSTVSPVITQKSKDTLAALMNMGADSTTTNINNLLAGSSVRIQDLVKKLSSGAGLRLAYSIFLT